MKLTAFKEKAGRLYFIMPVLIIALALLLRIVGADWGMPHSDLHPDEGLIFSQAYQCALTVTLRCMTTTGQTMFRLK